MNKDTNVVTSRYGAFAEKMMEKYGWKEGQGLGKDNQGISKAIRPYMKSDRAGLRSSEDTEAQDSTWKHILDKTLSNIEVKVNEDGDVKLTKKLSQKTTIFSSKPNKRKIDEDSSDSEDENPQTQSHKGTHASEDKVFENFRMTGHPGSRFNVMSGKQARIERMEREYLDQLTKGITSDHKLPNKLKKKKKNAK